MIELANLKFGYKVLHNLLPPVTRKLCMYDSSENTLSKQHSYNTRNKRTPFFPKNASKQYKNNALENKKELQVLSINSMIELANLKFGYKVLHNLLPPVTRKLCMYDSSENTLSKQHSYNTRNKRTPFFPKNASKQYKNSFLC